MGLGSQQHTAVRILRQNLKDQLCDKSSFPCAGRTMEHKKILRRERPLYRFALIGIKFFQKPIFQTRWGIVSSWNYIFPWKDQGCRDWLVDGVMLAMNEFATQGSGGVCC